MTVYEKIRDIPEYRKHVFQSGALTAAAFCIFSQMMTGRIPATVNYGVALILVSITAGIAVAEIFNRE